MTKIDPAEPATDRPRWWRQSKWRAFVAIGSTYLLIVVSTAFSFIALPSIADDFEVTLKVVGWVVITESLLIAGLLLPMGGIADTVGRKRTLFSGMGVFAIGAVSTGLAPTFALVIVARVILATGSALIQSVGTGMLAAIFPPEERGLALGAQTTAVAIGSATAPLLGGVALQVLSWRAMFVLLAVPSVASMIAIRFLVGDDRAATAAALGGADAPPRRRIDGLGASLSGLAVVALVLTINNPFDFAWLSVPIVVGGLLTVGLLAGFIWWELRVDQPMLDLRMFAIPVFRYAVLVRVVGFVAATTAMLLLPIYLLSAREISASLAGVLISTLAIGMGLSAQVSGRMYDRVGPRLPTVTGLILQVGTTVALSFADESTPLWFIGVVAFVAGVAMALWNVPNNSAMLGATPPESFGVGGAFTNVTRTVGNVIGQALTATAVAGVMASQGFDIPLGDLGDTAGAAASFIDGWQLAFLIAAGLSAVTLLFGLKLPDKSGSGH